ncbi:MAG: phytanoyl-CoA dioxygenase family protein [Burkholderiaceae bacterium]|nr:phytanoyl-CoA dioxygenase family protein [Burkholderiaceae bacterium]
MALSAEQLQQFQSDGYLVIKQLVPQSACDTMLAVTRAQLQMEQAPVEYETELGYPGAPASFDAPGGRTIRRLRGAYDRDACFRDWASDPAQVERITQLLGEPIVLTLAHHNCVMTKHPHFGTATGWHRDIRYWSFAKPDLVITWLALGPENGATGGLRFIPGSHRRDIAPHQLDALDFLRPEVAENQALFASGVQLDLDKGDVVLFHSKLFHAAGRNDSDALKTSVAFAYRGVSNPPVAGTRSAASGEVPLV